MNTIEIKQKIVSFIKSKAGDKPVCLGLSGGIDSAVCAYLAVEALGKDKVFGYVLSSQTNSEDDKKMANLVIEDLDLLVTEINVDEIIKSYETSGLFQDKKALGNLKARIRMSLLYGASNEKNGLVIGTGNKTEITVGYFTKYGDGGVDILPLGDLYKNQVRELAVELGVSKEIIERPPSAGLWIGQTDEAELGINYNDLDKILLAIENKENLDNFDQSKIGLVKKYIQHAKHKQELPPVCFINSPSLSS